MPVNLQAPRAEDLLAIDGVRIGVVEAGVRKANRKDLTVFLLDAGSSVGGVFTQNRYCPCGSGQRYKHCHGQLS